MAVLNRLLLVALAVSLVAYGLRLANAQQPCNSFDHNCDGVINPADQGLLAREVGKVVLPDGTLATRTPTPVPTSTASATPSATSTPTAAPTSGLTRTTTPSGVPIVPGTNVQAIIDLHPAGTTFVFTPGTHVNQSITPKNDMRFYTQGGVILDGGGTTTYAFRGNASGVTVDGFIIEDYNPPSQRGAISNQHNGGTYWTISNNEFRYNAAYGVRANTGDRLINNYFHHNEQAGFGGVGDDILAEGNEVAFNNPNDAFSSGWEAGGSKWSHTTNLILRDNYVHNNHGPGLWTDISNENTLFEGNVLVDNWGPGIFHEISFAAVIRDNTFSGNGWHENCGCWLWGAQILISTSSNVEVYGNVIDAPHTANGIGVIQQNRGSYLGYPVSVHHNDITLRSSGGTKARTGAVQDYDPTGQFFANVSMDFNAYHVDDVNGTYFGWNNGWRSFAQLRAAGRELNGTID